jgi:hypothetical protein
MNNIYDFEQFSLSEKLDERKQIVKPGVRRTLGVRASLVTISVELGV